ITNENDRVPPRRVPGRPRFPMRVDVNQQSHRSTASPMRKPRNLQAESSATGCDRHNEIQASPGATLAEDEITRLLNSIPWGPGDQLSATKLAQAQGVSVGRIHRTALTGNAIRSAEGARKRINLVMIKRFGEHWVSRRSFEAYLRALNS